MYLRCAPNFFPQKHFFIMSEIFTLLKDLTIKKTSKAAIVRAKSYQFNSSTLVSWIIADHAFKTAELLPINARGLFTLKDSDEIIVRGYDKFFNIGETIESSWDYLLQNAKGPFEMTLKENGCIIYVSQLNGELLVTSKHALGNTAPDGTPSHAGMGEIWLQKHLSKVNADKSLLVEYLASRNLTAVFELVDDAFEEHVLEYPPGKRGLYCHGLNFNAPFFDSLPTPEVHEFATRFGFRFVDLIVFDTVDKVKTFSDECAKTGCYLGNPIEGFVVRCFVVVNNQKRVHFFKIKFDNPYLMFREWRELTLTIINGKKPKRFRFELSRKYVSWCQAKFRQQPHLLKDFNKKKGIIAVRNLFLHEVEGLENFVGPEVMQLCAEAEISPDQNTSRSSLGKEKTLVIPIATIGSGKTTLARCLTILYPKVFGHIQNDNIQSKKGPALFEQKIMEEFLNYDIVVADRNNHLYQHREGLSTAFLQEYPGGKIVALDWMVDRLDKKAVIELTAKRVEVRGENHQSLTPGKTKNYKTIINNFVHRRDGLNLDHQSDSLITEVVEMDLEGTMESNLAKIVKVLDLEAPFPEDIALAFDQAKNFKEGFSKIVSNKASKPSYYGVKVDLDIVELIKDPLLSAGKTDLWNLIKSRNFDRTQWHATIAVASTKTLLYKEFNAKLSAINSEDPLCIGAQVKLFCSRLVWNDRVIALQIDRSLPLVPSVNAIFHITVSTLVDDAKPFESNELLALETSGSLKVDFCIEGIISPFYQ
jgi:tRNA ligase